MSPVIPINGMDLAKHCVPLRHVHCHTVYVPCPSCPPPPPLSPMCLLPVTGSVSTLASGDTLYLAMPLASPLSVVLPQLSERISRGVDIAHSVRYPPHCHPQQQRHIPATIPCPLPGVLAPHDQISTIRHPHPLSSAPPGVPHLAPPSSINSENLANPCAPFCRVQYTNAIKTGTMSMRCPFVSCVLCKFIFLKIHLLFDLIAAVKNVDTSCAAVESQATIAIAITIECNYICKLDCNYNCIHNHVYNCNHILVFVIVITNATEIATVYCNHYPSIRTCCCLFV